MRIPDEKKSSIIALSRKPPKVETSGILSIFSTSLVSRKEIVSSDFCFANFIFEEGSETISCSTNLFQSRSNRGRGGCSLLLAGDGSYSILYRFAQYM